MYMSVLCKGQSLRISQKMKAWIQNQNQPPGISGQEFDPNRSHSIFLEKKNSEYDVSSQHYAMKLRAGHEKPWRAFRDDESLCILTSHLQLLFQCKLNISNSRVYVVKRIAVTEGLHVTSQQPTFLEKVRNPQRTVRVVICK